MKFLLNTVMKHIEDVKNLKIRKILHFYYKLLIEHFLCMREWVYPQFQEYVPGVPLHPVVYERPTSLGVIYLI